MKYNGIELTEFTSDQNIAFNPPKEMVVWDNGDSHPCVRTVCAYIRSHLVALNVTTTGGAYAHCAEKPKGRTNWEVFCKRYPGRRAELYQIAEPNLSCHICPAKFDCSHRRPDCLEHFKKWANAEYEVDKE